jgi:hypothetical protein
MCLSEKAIVRARLISLWQKISKGELFPALARSFAAEKQSVPRRVQGYRSSQVALKVKFVSRIVRSGLAPSAQAEFRKQMEQRAGAKKDFEIKQSSVFAASGLPSLTF